MATLLKRRNSSAVKPVAAHHDRPFTSPIASAIVTVIAVLWTIPTL
ncbi:MAG: hypothetical protein RLZ23_627, partial [Actinomycetota bacterium]